MNQDEADKCFKLAEDYYQNGDYE